MHSEYFVPELFHTLRLLLVFGFIFGIIWLFKGRKGRRAQDDDTRLAQQMHQTLERMERRVEALETLLMEKERRHDR